MFRSLWTITSVVVIINSIIGDETAGLVAAAASVITAIEGEANVWRHTDKALY